MVWIHKNLISAAIKAGVRRFAPSEWGSAGSRGMAFYGYEDKVRKYLAEVVQEKNVRLSIREIPFSRVMDIH
ncbi:hypothetical protein BDV23DRAFT_182540 [Aspergillus alliaceus]|uniref:Uncharacterized protein n=1 Tax=Petromyces alliaceus TaxID=209559 RepID=A0A5N7CBG4_PETAA|nr:hypothetical protein BDV23DRAFT_182540 [Aspergillus alliaceus]